MINPYTLGSNAALTKLGFNPSSLLKPVLGGAAFGGVAGAVASPEGHRGEGAMRGAFLGGSLAGAGHLVGRAYRSARMRLPRAGITPSGKEPQLSLPFDGGLDAQQKFQKGLDKVPMGTAMLGGVGGAGLGIAKTEQNARMTDAQDPYGYRYR